MSATPPASTDNDSPPAPGGSAARVRAVVATICAGALACLAVVSWLDGHHPAPSGWALLAALGVVALGEVPTTFVRYHGQRKIYVSAEATFVVALAIVPGPWLVPLFAATVLSFQVFRRLEPVKISFNVGSTIIGVSVGCLIAHAIGGAGELPASGGYVAAVAAAVAYGLFSSLAVAWVMAAATGTPYRALLAHEVESRRPQMALGYALVGVAVLALAHWNPFALPVLPPVVAGLYFAYRAHMRSNEQRNDWKQLNAAERELADLDEGEVARLVRARAMSLFGADDVLLTLDPIPAEELATLTVEEPALPPPSRRRARFTRMPETSAPLLAGHRTIGQLRLTFKHPAPWSDHEDQVLAALANTVSSAVVRKRLFDHARRQAEEKTYEATHDALTGLGNRRLLGECADQMLAGTDASGARVGLLLIDLDRFKEINDSLGHSAGDRVLRGIADRLRHSVRTGDVVTRLGGDEFAVLVSDIDHPAQAESVAADLADVLARPIELDEFTLAVEGSVGVAVYPDDGANTEELLSRADIAMYQAKRAHPRWQRYRSDRDVSNVDRLSLLAELRPAIGGGDLVLYYQPQMALRGGRITGVEALVRWKHPVRGLLTPETFVPAVEQSGFVQEFTRAILRQALEACAGWRDNGYDVGISVNLSARNLLNTDLPGEVAQLLLSYRVPAPALTLEITETAMMADPETAESLLASLSEIGVRIAVDDFGTGYSSLTLLQRCVLHEVKVDRAFVQRLLLERSDAAIVAATIQLAHSLGLKVVAEGVESEELVEALAALHCDTGQGLHIGGAMPLAELTRWLADTARTARLDTGPGARILPLHPRRPATG